MEVWSNGKATYFKNLKSGDEFSLLTDNYKVTMIPDSTFKLFSMIINGVKGAVRVQSEFTYVVV